MAEKGTVPSDTCRCSYYNLLTPQTCNSSLLLLLIPFSKHKPYLFKQLKLLFRYLFHFKRRGLVKQVRGLLIQAAPLPVLLQTVSARSGAEQRGWWSLQTRHSTFDKENGPVTAKLEECHKISLAGLMVEVTISHGQLWMCFYSFPHASSG